MALDQHVSNLVSTTINAFNGDATSVSPMDGISLIDSWMSALQDTDQSTNPVASGLGDLKAELQSGNPNGTQIGQILEELVDQVKVAADSAEADVKIRLTALTGALQGFSQQLGGSSKLQNGQDQQAPMTSTVGGESTTSGVGASAYYTNNDDDLSNRNGGAASVVNGGNTPTMDADDASDNDSAMGMDDMTGNEGGLSPTTGNTSGESEDVGDSESGSGYGASSEDGGRPEDGGSYGSGYGTGSDGDDYSRNSGTQRSGVSGGSTSSGSSDTDTGSSGGRSQY